MDGPGTLVRVDEVLREAMEPVLRDLEGAGIASPRVEDDNWTGDIDWPSAMLCTPEGNGSGVCVARSAPLGERVAWVADQVQDWAIEELWAKAMPTNWPPCPHHPNGHPTKVATRDATAVWVCPIDATLVAIVGSVNE